MASRAPMTIKINGETVLQIFANTNAFPFSESYETSLMDQVTYAEEVNQHLRATIKDLEDKLAKANCKEGSSSPKADKSPERTLMEVGTIIVNKEKQLIEAEKMIDQLENRIRLYAKDMDDSRMKMITLNTDIKEKEDTIVRVRSQLDEIKEINIQMFSKLKEKDAEIKEKTDKLSESESQMSLLRKEIKRLEKR